MNGVKENRTLIAQARPVITSDQINGDAKTLR